MIIQTEAQFTSGAYGKRELALVRGQDCTVWDADGNAYLDCVAGISVANVGHCHPRVVTAVQQQAATLLTCPEMFYNDQRAQLLERLVSLLPRDEGRHLNRLFLCNSGTEAVEGAIKFARLSTGRTGIIATMRGFHGRTMGSLSATHKASYRKPFGPLVPDFQHVRYGDDIALADKINENTAAVLLEIIQGEGGIRTAPASYFQAVRRLCDEHGALLIIDEVQTGFGRTGRWFACEHMGIVPDLMALGKAMAGGVPMGAVAIADHIQNISAGVHGSTFGGNPLACSAALATLSILEDENLVARSAELGAWFCEQLVALELPLVREVRGLGLMIGIECRQRVYPIVQRLMAQGMLTLTAGSTVLRLLPPLTITRQQLQTVLDTLAQVLQPEVA